MDTLDEYLKTKIAVYDCVSTKTQFLDLNAFAELLNKNNYIDAFTVIAVETAIKPLGVVKTLTLRNRKTLTKFINQYIQLVLNSHSIISIRILDMFQLFLYKETKEQILDFYIENNFTIHNVDYFWGCKNLKKYLFIKKL